MSWIDSMKEAIGTSLQELSRALEDRTSWTSLIHRVTRNWSRFSGISHTRPLVFPKLPSLVTALKHVSPVEPAFILVYLFKNLYHGSVQSV